MGVAVECHSGHTYAERPKAFYLDDVRLEVEIILAEWRCQAGKHFRIKTKNGSVFELVYDENNDIWQVKET
jgi:hypothetical protein